MSGGPGPEPPELVAVGRVLRAHGIHGAVLVAPLSDVSERFDAGSRLLLGPDGDRVLRVVDRRGQPIKPLLRFEGIVDRTSAEALAGTYLFVPASESPELPEDEFWPYQLIGLPVVTASGRDLGTIREVLRTPTGRFIEDLGHVRPDHNRPGRHFPARCAPRN